MQLETVGEIVRILRARRGLDQIDLARACGWRDASAVSRIETDRIRPTRRTLLKLAESLSGPETFPVEQVRARLYAAAGILPTREDVERVRQELAGLSTWSCPVYLTDFSWTVWAANDPCVDLLGLPANHVGRNLLEMFFEPGSCREKVGDAWVACVEDLLRSFRAQTGRRTQQRWYRNLITNLSSFGDFGTAWERVAATGNGKRGYALPVDSDPRFAVVPVFSLPGARQAATVH